MQIANIPLIKQKKKSKSNYKWVRYIISKPSGIYVRPELPNFTIEKMRTPNGKKTLFK